MPNHCAAGPSKRNERNWPLTKKAELGYIPGANARAFLCTSAKNIFFKGCPGWGANPGSFDFIYFFIPSLYR
jgi:hypothetical protein